MRRFSRRSVPLTSSLLLLAAGGLAACDGDLVDEDHRFYCADQRGVVVDSDRCERDNGSGGFFLFHSTGYAPGYTPGTQLPPGGRSFPYKDMTQRKHWNLGPGKVTNGGTVKVSVVGKGGLPRSAGG